MAQPQVTTQSKEKRIKNFNEVSLGFSKKLASEEARRCPQCPDPVCVKDCPLGIDIPAFIRFLREGHVASAYDKIKEKNPLPSICGRVCSAPCEVACVLKEEGGVVIAIRALERHSADYGKSRAAKRESQYNGKKIAVVGSGPSGLSSSVDLTRRGYAVTIFEALDKPGGVLRYGIPEFRLPRKILDSEINDIKTLGVKIETNFFIGQTATLGELFKEGFAAVLIATGAGIPKFMDIPGTHWGGVYYGEEFLMRLNLMRPGVFSRQSPNFALGEHVAVIGSGNTALDCARVCRRYGRKVTLLFRRSEVEMLVRAEERGYAREEGIQFEPLVRPVEILADQHHFVNGLKCVRMDYADADVVGQWELAPVPDSEFVLDVDTVICAIGHKPNALISHFDPALKINKDGTLKVDGESGLTTIPGVFACGNVVSNAGPLVAAMASGIEAAQRIDAYVKK
ncbi:MAG TPA: dihydropyrimidine dehydrogenase [Candidatus Omnitrophica bacterium]|nr:dihydropyrimidine dehydrogenase [Candidatus Omnitrophota bacterium]